MDANKQVTLWDRLDVAVQATIIATFVVLPTGLIAYLLCIDLAS